MLLDFPRNRRTAMWRLRIGMVYGALLTAYAGPLGGQEHPQPSPPRSPLPTPQPPQWNLGDRWTVESVGKRMQVRRGGEAPTIRPIQWQFSLSRFEKSLTHDCFRVEIRCLANENGRPLTTLWVDRQSRALRQIATEIPVPGGYHTITLNYDCNSGQPSPVIGPLTALPIDLPVLLAARSKGLETFHYRSSSGTPQAKEVDPLLFEHAVEQQIAAVDAAEARKLLDASFAKSLDDDPLTKSIGPAPVCEVRLKSAGREIRQLWQDGAPWPIYADNGHCVCRLVSVQPAETAQEVQP
jgi:hypothetical protein